SGARADVRGPGRVGRRGGAVLRNYRRQRGTARTVSAWGSAGWTVDARGSGGGSAGKTRECVCARHTVAGRFGRAPVERGGAAGAGRGQGRYCSAGGGTEFSRCAGRVGGAAVRARLVGR